MPAPHSTHAGSLLDRVLGIIHAPRATCEAVARAPRWFGVLAFTFLVTTACTAILLETGVGQLALLDQWERTASAFGQAIDDTQYAAMEDASRSGATYAVLSSFVSGPLLTVGVSGLLLAAFRPSRVAERPDQPVLAGRSAFADRQGPVTGPVTGSVTYRQVLAVAAHAGVILALRQVVAAPVTYARETLTSPMTLGLFFRMLNDASLAARFFGIIDLFVIWWIVVLSIGVSVLYRRPARRLVLVLLGTYVTLAALLAVVMAVIGGTA